LLEDFGRLVLELSMVAISSTYLVPAVPLWDDDPFPLQIDFASSTTVSQNLAVVLK